MNDIFRIPLPDNDLKKKAYNVRQAFSQICQSNNKQRVNALHKMADALNDNSQIILEANLNDYKSAKEKGISQSLLSRLKLNKDKLQASIEGIRKVSELEDPLGQVCIFDLPAPFIVINFLMTDFTEENGAIRFVPGTQRTRLRPPPIKDEPAHWQDSIICAPAGTAILRDVRCWHGGTANRSASPRIMTSAGYYAPWFTRESERELGLNEYLKMTERGKKLCRNLVNWEPTDKR